MSHSSPPFEPTVWRASGGGNDFLALPEPERLPTPDEVRAWCRRGLSLGADGVFVLSRGEIQGDSAADPPRVVMRHFNPDGGEAALCLNGTRCAARLAFELGWARKSVELATGAGSIHARPRGEDIAVTVPLPAAPPTAWEGSWEGPKGSLALTGHGLIVGVPHLVVPWPTSLVDAPVEAFGAEWVHQPVTGPGGVNVHLVRWPRPDRLEIRSYERGVFAETLACGTGTLAAVAARLASGEPIDFPLRALTRGGFTLTVEAEKADAAGGEGAKESADEDTKDKVSERAIPLRWWRLAGDARLLMRGAALKGASRVPPPPDWSS